jgi:hypothetical protein
MKRKIAAQALLSICVLLVLPSLSTAEEIQRDGNWWLTQNRLTRCAYLVGFFDGMDLGHNFSYGTFSKVKKMKVCIRNMEKSYNDLSAKYFNNVSSGKLVDGLDSFYTDSHNLSILVADAIWVVINIIASTPQDKLDKMIDELRSNSK